MADPKQISAGGTNGQDEDGAFDEAGKCVNPNLSINPDPRFFVPRPDEPLARIKSFIESSSGGVIGLTGVRGAGKSILLKKIVADFGDKTGETSETVDGSTAKAEDVSGNGLRSSTAGNKGFFTLQITAPTTSSDETAFFVMLYKRLCETVIAKLNNEYFKKKMDAVARGRRAARLAMTPLAIVIAAATILLAGLAYIGAYWYAFENEKKDLTAAIESLVEDHSKSSKAALKNKKQALQAKLSTDSPQKTADYIASAKETLRSLKQDVSADEMALKFTNDLISLEKMAMSELGPLKKLTGDIPHPALMLSFILKKEGSFELERDFLEPRKVPAAALKKVGLSSRAADAIVGQIRKVLSAYKEGQKEEPPAEPYGNAVFSQIVLAGSGTFEQAADNLKVYRENLSKKLRKTTSDIETLEKEIAEAKQSTDIAQKQKVQISAAKIEAEKAIVAEDGKIALAASEFRVSISDLSFFGRDLNEFLSQTLPSEQGVVIEAAQKVKDTISGFSSVLTSKDFSGPDAGKIYTESMNAPMTNLTTVFSTPTLLATVRNLKTTVILIIVLIGAAALTVLLLLRYFLGLWTKYRRFGPEAGLIRLSEEKIRRLDFDITRTRSGRFSLPIFRSSASVSASEQLRGRALTLPGLTADYMEYIKQVQEVFEARTGNPKLIICIDELDKITNSEEVGKVLREIKGALFQDNCFYLLSISEDAVRAFESRFVEKRDIFESTFDEIMFLERLNLPTCVSIARKRFETSGYGPEDRDNPSIDRSIELAAIVSAGVPREFLRNLRVMVSSADELTKVDPVMVWHHLLRRKLKEARQRIRAVDVREGFRANLLVDFDKMIGELDDLFANNKLEFTLYTEKTLLERVPKIADRCVELKDEVQKVGEELKTDLPDARWERLNLELSSLNAWRKLWLELLIYLRTWQSYLIHTRAKNSEALNRDFAQLIYTYAILPYNSDICETYLREFDGCPQAKAAE